MKLRYLISNGRVPAAVEGSEIERQGGRILRDEGASLVEIAVSVSLLCLMLFGFIEVSLALYNYHFVADAAREATRFAMVRGGNCPGNVNAAYCSPTSNATTGADNADIQAYVQGLGFPFAHALTTSTTWYAASTTLPATWSSCGATKCNAPGNMVQVSVTNNFSFGVPFWQRGLMTISSTSSMVIAQ
jgi:Flp pilus assembly protein TadG